MIYRYLFVSLLKVLTFLGYLVKQIIHHKLTKETREKEKNNIPAKHDFI